jgi:hypothetical protein
MNQVVPSHCWLPLVLVIVQTCLLSWMVLSVLYRGKFLQNPISGMEYGVLLPTGSILLGVLIISSADIPALFQAARAYFDKGSDVFPNTFRFFARIFITAMLVCTLFVIMGLLNIFFLFKEYKKTKSLAIGILLAIVCFGMAIVFWYIERELSQELVPKIFLFN